MSDEILDVFHLRAGPLLPLLYHPVLKILDIRQQNEVSVQSGEEVILPLVADDITGCTKSSKALTRVLIL